MRTSRALSPWATYLQCPRPQFKGGVLYLDGKTDDVDYYWFAIRYPREVHISLRQHKADADLHLEVDESTVLASSETQGVTRETSPRRYWQASIS